MDPVEERLRRLHDKALSSVRRLRAMNFTMLEADIMDRLIEGRRTAVELVVEIYGLSREDPAYRAACIRVRRALRGLEHRGMVSTKLFGRDKPYRLTRHGVALLASISEETDGPTLLPPWSRALFGSTLFIGILMLLASRGFLGELGGWAIYLLVATFFWLFGFSLGVVVLIGRRVS